MRIISSLILALTMWVPTQANEICTLVAHAGSGAVIFERGDCTVSTTPASTFKVPLAVMGFDAGFLASSAEPVLSFHPGDPDWVADWKKDTNPTQWMTNSTLWYSQRITQALGADAFAAYLAKFQYGNADASGDAGQNNGLKRSWISSSLKITPREQARFVRELLHARLPVSAAAQSQALALVQWGGEVNGWAVYGKTGSAYPRRADQSFDYARGWGWYVGWAQKGQEAYVVVRLNQETQRRSGSTGVLARDALLKDMGSIRPFDAP
jgi:beta-lactamase class D